MVVGVLINDDNTTVNKVDTTSKGCSGYGSQSCIDEIRRLVRGSGKEIAGERYNGNGEFEIDCFEFGPGGVSTIVYHMDCNCTPTSVIVR